MRWLLILGCCFLYVRISEAVSCALELPLQQLNTVPGIWNNVYIDLVLPCSGPVKSWQYYAIRAGTFYATVWRPDTVGGNTYYTMVGKNEITAPGPGLQEAEITEGNYIHAQAGDVIGIHYPDTATGAEHAVVYVETSTSTSTITTELSDVITTNSQDPCLPPGSITSSVSISNTQRVPALSVYIEESTSVTGDPHFMMTSRYNGNRLCFDADGSEGQVMKLIEDQDADIFVNGRLFEIEASTKEKRQSYFSDIAVINSQLTVIGSKLNITISDSNGNTLHVLKWGEQFDSRVGNAHIVTGEIPNSIKVLVDNGVGLQLKMTRGKKIGPFIGVFVVHSDPLSSKTKGVIGKFIHAEFDVYDIDNQTAKIHFTNIDNEDIPVQNVTRWNGVLRGQAQCWLYKPASQETNHLIGSQTSIMVPHLNYTPEKKSGWLY